MKIFSKALALSAMMAFLVPSVIVAGDCKSNAFKTYQEAKKTCRKEADDQKKCMKAATDEYKKSLRSCKKSK